MENNPLNITWESVPLFLIFISISINTPATAQELPNAWINEIHYNNTGTDAGEAIEIVVEAENFEGFDISFLRVELYNGNDGKSYRQYTFSSENLGNHISPFTIYSINTPGIQNGNPDGIALSYAGTLIQFISYGGSFTALDGIADGLISTDIDVTESSDTPLNYSLQLGGTGNRYKTFLWEKATLQTFGKENTDQTLVVIDGPQPVSNLKQVFIAPDKLSISWTKPIGVHSEDWDGVLIFASDKGPNEIDFAGKDYTAFGGGGQIYGEGTATINGYTVVRSERDENGEFLITGLQKDQAYSFIGYTFLNIPGGRNDLFSNPSEEIQLVAKGSEVTDFQGTPLGQKARLSWKNTMGEFNTWWHEILIIASENEITTIPNQKTYIASPAFGTGETPAPGEFVIFAGSDSVAFIEGLENNQNYNIKIFVRYDAGDDFFWSSGLEITCKPFDNKKQWTGNAGTNLYMDPANWFPTGVPGISHDVILDHTHITPEYEVVLATDAPIDVNSITISPHNTETITLNLTSEENTTTTLTLHDDKTPLTISDHGILVNSLSYPEEALNTPNANITLAPSGKYIHHTQSKHTKILDKVSLDNGVVPGTIEFDVPGEKSFLLSISGRSFQKLVFSSEKGIPYNAMGSNSITIKEALIINKDNDLNLTNFNAPIHIEGDLDIQGSLQFNNEIIFEGDKNQTVSGMLDGSVPLRKIIINKPVNNVVLGSDIEVLETLEFIQGNLETEAHHFVMSFVSENQPVIIGAPEKGSVIGNLKVTRNVMLQETAFEYGGITFKEGEENLGAVSVIRNTGPEAVIENGTSKSIARNWVINAAQPLSKPRNIEFKWEEKDENGFENASVQLWQESETQDEWLPIGSTQNGTTRNIIVGVEKLSKFTISNIENPLPITLVSFDVRPDNHKAQLWWITNGESSNEGFEIQKSVDSKNFLKIGYVEGSNNTLERTNYDFEDSNFNQNSYYRLKQIDYDGSFSFSPIRFLPFRGNGNYLFVSPNPVKFPVKIINSPNIINRDKKIDYCFLYAASGLQVYETKDCQIDFLENKLNNFLPGLQSGLYILTLSVENQIHNIKLIKE